MLQYSSTEHCTQIWSQLEFTELRSSNYKFVHSMFWQAQVVCRQLGYGSAVSALGRAFFGRGTGPQWDVNWYCSGTESSLQSCRTVGTFCDHSEDASVRCSGSSGELKYAKV